MFLLRIGKCGGEESGCFIDTVLKDDHNAMLTWYESTSFVKVSCKINGCTHSNDDTMKFTSLGKKIKMQFLWLVF